METPFLPQNEKSNCNFIHLTIATSFHTIMTLYPFNFFYFKLYLTTFTLRWNQATINL